MPSISNIPEPTTAYRPEPDSKEANEHYTLMKAAQGAVPEARPATHTAEQLREEPQQQIDSISCLLILLAAGGLLRLVLGLLGPFQGTDAAAWQQLTEQGRNTLSNQPSDPFPLAGLLNSAVVYFDLPAWVLVAFGALLTFLATPAAYVIGRVTTGRRAAGILAAALVAVHPAVLAASISLSSTAIALGLLTIGLGVTLHAAKKGSGLFAVGGLMLGLAGLAAPLCWIAAALAGPLAGHVALEHGFRRAFTYAVTVFVLAVAPAMAYRAVSFGHTPDALLYEFADHPFAGSHLPPGDRLLIALTDPSLNELGEALRLPIGDAGKLAGNTIAIGPRKRTAEDPVADVLADGWLLMNAALASLAAVSIGVMLARRRVIEAVVLTAPLLAMAYAHLTPGEALRLPMIAMMGVLAAGLLANKPEAVVDEKALAEKAAKKSAKLAAREEKQRAKQERGATRELAKLYAFDKPKRASEKKARKPDHQAAAPEQAQQQTGILTSRPAEDTSIPSRPI